VNRTPLHAPRGAVATSQSLATAAGLDALRRGGTAVDAALAATIALTVVQPGSTGIGGDLFAIVWAGDRPHGLNASGRSPAALTRDAVLAATGDSGAPPSPAHGGAQATTPTLPVRGWLPVTVPGAPAGWKDLHDRFGRLPYADLFADAIGYAAGGFPVSPRVAAGWARAVRMHATLGGGEALAEWPRVFTVDGGRAPRAGERWSNPEQARTLRLIAETGSAAFYRGEIADALDAHAARTGGLLTGDDLAAHASTWVDPFAVGYRGHEVWELPPNGQGLAASIALSILDGVDLAGAPPGERLHLRIEAVKRGFAVAHEHVADPDAVRVPVADLLAADRIATLRASIGDTASVGVGEPARGGTVYLCAADADGLMVSLIQSTYLGFGSHVVLPGFGFGLQNRGIGFSLDPEHPNVVGPGKRPFHTIMPGFLTRGGEPVGPFGVMGGHMQPQGHVQLVGETVDDGRDPQAALDAPRWYWHAGRQVLVEPGLAGAVEALRERGHEVAVDDDPSTYGCGQAIWRGPGGLVAGSETRADGSAAGY
jgi:gamma-glutamyltranspeptidase/glutathione hydrolase